MGHNLKLSVIIPVYNTAAYLEGLFASLTAQTYDNLEIIFVDDGSADESPKILQDFALRDNRVKVISQPNGGLPVARNAGLAACSGQYITFIDGDDMLCSAQAYAVLMPLIVKNNCDVLKFSITRLNKEGAISHKVKINYPSGVYEGAAKDKLLKAIILNDGIDNSASDCIFKKEFLDKNSLSFNKQGISHGEDLLFTMLYMPVAQRVFLSADTHFYGYRDNPRSLGRSYDAAYAAHTLLLADRMLRQIQTFPAKEYFYSAFCSRVINLAFYVLLMETSPLNKRSFCAKKEYMRGFFNEPVIKDALKAADFKKAEFLKALPVKLAAQGLSAAAYITIKAESFLYSLKGIFKL